MFFYFFPLLPTAYCRLPIENMDTVKKFTEESHKKAQKIRKQLKF
jgi:hypothetical protein